VQFSPHGGDAPYSYAVSNGGGLISQNGLFTAPTSVVGYSQAVTITVTDAVGAATTATVVVLPSGSAMTAPFTPNPPTPGSAVTITATGGTAPYTYTLISGSGQLTGNTYIAPLTAETASVRVTDQTGQITTVSIPIAQNNVIVSLTITAEG